MYLNAKNTNKTNDSHECKVSHYWYYFKYILDFNSVYVIVVMIYYKNLKVLMKL